MLQPQAFPEDILVTPIGITLDEISTQPMKFFIDTRDVTSDTIPDGPTPKLFEGFIAQYEQACHAEKGGAPASARKKPKNPKWSDSIKIQNLNND